MLRQDPPVHHFALYIVAAYGLDTQLDQPIALTDLYNTPGDDFGKEGFVFVFPARHNGGNNYLFYDGHMKWMKSFLGRNWRAKD